MPKSPRKITEESFTNIGLAALSVRSQLRQPEPNLATIGACLDRIQRICAAQLDRFKELPGCWECGQPYE